MMTHDGTKYESLTFNPIRVLFDFRLKKNEKRENQNVTIPYQKLFVVLPEQRTNPNIFIFGPKQNVAKNYYDRPEPWPLLGSFFSLDQSKHSTILCLENRNKVMSFIKWTLWKKIKYQIILQMYPQRKMSHHQLLRLYNLKIKHFIVVQKYERNIFYIYGSHHRARIRKFRVGMKVDGLSKVPFF